MTLMDWLVGLFSKSGGPAEGDLPVDWEKEQLRLLEPLEMLPHGARVAFAAQCARIALREVRQLHEEMPETYSEAVERAILAAEEAARSGGSTLNGEELAKAALMVGNALPHGNRAAESAAHAALAFSEGPDGSSKSAFLAMSEAINLAREIDNVAVLRRLQANLEYLLQQSRAGKWNDSTALGAEFAFKD